MLAAGTPTIQRRPSATAIRVCGLNPGQTPHIEIDYEDDRDTVQRVIDGSDELQRLIADAMGLG